MKRIVISQPMFFPWVGIFEQLRLADLFIHYDDVQLSQGRSFSSRVQIKSHNGIQWLTIPIIREKNQIIKDVLIDESQDWRSRHLKTLVLNYGKARFSDEMLALANDIYSFKTKYLSEFNIFAIEKVANFFGLSKKFAISSEYKTKTHGSEKILEILLLVKGTTYITGHGARNYLNHELFENNGIKVEYMDYQRTPYPQLHGEFDPHVSILDLIASVGREGIEYINSSTKNWQIFLDKD